MQICVVGLGYIGLPTATLFARFGVQVLGVDVNESVVNSINQGKPHIQEADLDHWLQLVVKDGLFKASTKPEPADVFIIAVPTPFKEDRQPDLTYVEAATHAVAPYVQKGNLVVLESTSPVGTTEQMAEWIYSDRSDLKKGDVFFAHCPERVLPGQILKELVENDRIVGGIDETSTKLAQDLYGRVVKGNIICTDARTAELTKLTENSFRDVNIAFANELSMICSRLGVDVWSVIELANRHPRVKILSPGPGVGGHCIAVDPWFIVSSAPEQSRLIKTARQVNDSKPHFVVEQVVSKSAALNKPKIACLGLTYKANVDDFRESPSVEIVDELAKALPDASLFVVEPYCKQLPPALSRHSNVQFVNLSQALEESQIVVLLVDHTEFKQLKGRDWGDKQIVDTRGVWR